MRSALKKLGARHGPLDAEDNLTAHPRELIVNPALSVSNADNLDMTAA